MSPFTHRDYHEISQVHLTTTACSVVELHDFILDNKHLIIVHNDNHAVRFFNVDSPNNMRE